LDTDNTFIIRKFQSSDIDEIVRLLNLVQESKHTRQWWRWKYELNPNGFSPESGDIWVAEKEDKIVGYYAIIPENLKFHSKVVRVAQSVDTATHPECRKMGLFTALASRVYSDARNRYRFIYGFPSAMAYHGFLRLGWQDFPTPEYLKVLDYDRFVRKFGEQIPILPVKLFLRMFTGLNRLHKTQLRKKIDGRVIEIEEVESFPDDIDAFWEQLAKAIEVVIERTGAFLNWRFSAEFGSYRIFIGRSLPRKNIVGYMVLAKRVEASCNVLDIVDLVTLPKETRAMLQLMDLAIRIGNDEDLDVIRCWFPEPQKSAAFSAERGFIPLNKVSRLARRYGGRLILYGLASGTDLPNTREWFYTLADTDFA
jgi:GNAT superfamily N-acetyltransferase